ncbi:helix-turn-helix domain-containing protein, partial [Enterococcus faecalis]|nr:helix-turn-helix domain-containing protein [Enterococcus faecalis]
MRRIKDTLEMSSTSVRRCIHEINSELDEIFPQSNISILFLGMGYSLSPSNIQNSIILEYLKLFYIKQSNEFIILNALLSKRYVSINQLSFQINISTSHLYKYIKNIRTFLGYFKLDISFSSKEATNSCLIGTKINKLYFLNIYYWDIDRNIEWPYFTIDNFSFYENPFLSPFQKKRIQQILAVSKHPTVKNNQYESDSDFKDICNIFRQFHFNAVNLEQNFPYNDSMTDLECIFIRLFIPEFDSDLIKVHIAQSASVLSHNEIVSLSTTFLNCLFEEYQVKPSKAKYSVCFYYSLVMHIFLKYVNVDFFNTLESFPRLRDLSNKDLSFIRLEADLLLFYEELTNRNKQYQLQVSKANTLYMVNFCYSILDYCIDTKKIYIYVELTQNIFSTQMVKKNLIAIFGRENIELIDSQKLADIIIIDFFQEEMDSKKVYYFENLYSNDSWTNILSFITAMLYKKK